MVSNSVAMLELLGELPRPPAIRRWYGRFGKRALDLAVSLGACLCLLPVFLLVALAIKLDSPGPVLFVQRRLGKDGKVFVILKFRTMTHRKRSLSGEVLDGNDEVTRVGRFLRRTKLDEAIQLFNVVAGQVSLVGPRPAAEEQLEEYTPEALHRLLVRPGLTGLAQVNGNIYLSWQERWVYDRRYVETLSLGQDLRIIGRTFAVIFKGERHYLCRPTASDGESA